MLQNHLVEILEGALAFQDSSRLQVLSEHILAQSLEKMQKQVLLKKICSERACGWNLQVNKKEKWYQHNQYCNLDEKRTLVGLENTRKIRSTKGNQITIQ